MIRLSIIVPFYNVEKYVEECIHSLYDQDIPQEEYEVICVDDCSPDGSRAIVERLQKEYSTLRLICQERNKKLGGARNTGLKEAKGRYVWFVDSDDTICTNVMKSLLDHAEKNRLEILQFDYMRGKKIWRNGKEEIEIQNGEDYLFKDQSDRWYDKLSGAWRQLYSKEFLTKNKLEFIEDAMYEDTDYLLRAFLMAKKVQYIPIVAYNYRVNDESVTLSTITPERLAWRANLIARSRQCVRIAQTHAAKETINKMVTNYLTSLRSEVKALMSRQRRMYVRYLNPIIGECRNLVNWRTWMAIRYGITMFV